MKMSSNCNLLILFLLAVVCEVVLSQQYHGFIRELPHFTEQPFNTTAFIGETVMLTCSVAHLAGNQAVAWMKLNPTSSFLTSGTQSFSSPEGKLVVVGEHTEGNLQYNLLINNVSESDAGEYICTVVEFGDLHYRRWRRSSVAKIKVVRPTSRPTLQCVTDPQSTYVAAGVQRVLGCRLNGAGQRDIRISMNWTREGGYVLASTRFEGIRFESGKHTPELFHQFQVSNMDHGAIFQCSVMYDHYNGIEWEIIHDRCSLNPLQVRPHTKLTLSDRKVADVYAGEEVHFICPANDARTPGDHAYTWNIVPTIAPSRFRLSHRGDKLIVQRVTIADDGLRVSCFIPPLTATTHKKEMQLKVRKIETNFVWEARKPSHVVPFGPESLKARTTGPNDASTTYESLTNFDTPRQATATPMSAIKRDLTTNSINNQHNPGHRLGPFESFKGANVQEIHESVSETTVKADHPETNMTNSDKANILVHSTTSLSLPPSSTSDANVTGVDLDSTYRSEMNSFEIRGQIEDLYESSLGESINGTEFEDTSLTSSDFIFIFVMVAEVLLTVLLVILLLITGPICFASKRRKDHSYTDHTDIEKANGPVPLKIGKDGHVVRTDHEKVRSPIEKKISASSEKVKYSTGSNMKEIPTVDIILSFEMKEKVKPTKSVSSEASTVPASSTDEQTSVASTVEFKTFGYPRYSPNTSTDSAVPEA